MPKNCIPSAVLSGNINELLSLYGFIPALTIPGVPERFTSPTACRRMTTLSWPLRSLAAARGMIRGYPWPVAPQPPILIFATDLDAFEM